MRQSKGRTIKPTKAWAVVWKDGKILDIGMDVGFAVFRDKAATILYAKEWCSPCSSVTPVLISPVGRKLKK